MQVTELWYHKLGFFNNPFSIKPAAFYSEIIGYDLEEIFSKIESGAALFVKGPMGVGKTTILKNILLKFGGKGKVIYTSCNTSDKKISFRELLIGGSFLSRLFSSPSRNMILLVDEAQEIKKQETAEILRLLKKGNFKSVVFFGTDYPEEKMVPNLHLIVKDNIKTLSRLKPESAVELVRKRVGDIPLMPDAVIRKVYRLSGYNPRALLENCEDLLRHAVDSGASRITDEHFRAIVREIRVVKVKPKDSPKIVIEEIHDVDLPLEIEPMKRSKKVKTSDYGIRSYEEEMETIKQNVDEEI